MFNCVTFKCYCIFFALFFVSCHHSHKSVSDTINRLLILNTKENVRYCVVLKGDVRNAVYSENYVLIGSYTNIVNNLNISSTNFNESIAKLNNKTVSMYKELVVNGQSKIIAQEFFGQGVIESNLTTELNLSRWDRIYLYISYIDVNQNGNLSELLEYDLTGKLIKSYKFSL